MSAEAEKNQEDSALLNWKDFSAQLKILWEKDGSLQESLDLIEAHPGHRKNQGQTGRRQILRAFGEDRLISGGVIIPERSPSAVYEPVSNRVMYCVYSTPVFNSNGYSTRSRGVAAGLKSAGADVVVVARAGYPWDWQIDTPMPAKGRIISKLDEIEYVHLPNGSISALSPSAHIEQAAEAFVQEALIQRPACIQVASNYRVALPALIAARRLGIPFIYEVRGLWEITGASNKPGFEQTDRYMGMRDLESRVARSADHVFAITAQVKAELISRGVSESKISLAPNAVEPHKFHPTEPSASAAKTLGLQPGLPVIGFAGSIVKYEGLQTLLEASRLLISRGVKHQVALAGSGNTEPALKKFAEKHGMKWVHFLGRIPQDQVPKLLSISDIIVTPRDSTVITELVSALKPLEAFSAGRAVVLSDVAPNVDLAGPAESRAKLFEAGNPTSFADVVEMLLSDSAERVKLAKSARHWIETERNWHAIGRSMLNQIQKLDQESASEGGSSVKLDDLKVGLIGGAKIESLLTKHSDVIRLQTSDIELQELASLDFLLIDLSGADNLGGSHSNNEILISDPEVQDLLLKCKLAGVPRVGLIAEGLNDSTFTAEQAHLLDVCLSGKFEGVVEFLEDPNTVDLRVGNFPPILSDPDSGVLQNEELNESIWIVDASGVRAGSSGLFMELLQTDASADSVQEQSMVVSNIEDAVLQPGSIFVRDDTPESLKRALISQFGLTTPIVWEGKNQTSIEFGDAFAEDISLIEFLACQHHWQENPESCREFILRQKYCLVSSHMVRTRLILLCRSLGIPVRSELAENPPAVVIQPDTGAQHFSSEVLSAYLQDRAEDLAPVIHRVFRS